MKSSLTSWERVFVNTCNSVKNKPNLSVRNAMIPSTESCLER